MHAPPLTFRFLKRTSLLLAIETAVLAAVAFYLGRWSSTIFHVTTRTGPIISGLWCVLSAISVMQGLVNETIKSAWERILGSFIGSLMGSILAASLGYGVPALVICMFSTVIIVTLIKIPDAYRLACLTGAMVIIVGILNPEVPAWQNGASRLIETVLGGLIATVMIAIMLPLYKRLKLKN